MNIPSSWTVIKFDELNEFKSATINPNNFSLEKFDLYSVPIFPLGKPENLIGQEIGSTKQLVEPDDILISKINPRINRVWKVAKKKSLRQIASSEWIVFRNKYLEPRYFLYYFRSPKFREKLCADVTGVGGSLTRAQPKRVAEFLLPVAPLAEQRRIADKLDTTLARVDALNDQLARITPLLKRFRQSVLAAATSGRFSDDNWLPKFELLGNVCLKVTDGEHSTPKRESDGRYLISARNIRDGYIDLSKVDYVGESEFLKLRQRCDPQIGDVLLSCSGSVGRVALVDKNDCYVMVRSAALIRPNSEILDSKYLMFVLQSPLLQEQIENSTKSTAQANIFLGPIKKLTIPLVDISIQKNIVRNVETLFAFVDRLEARLQSAQTAAERLTPALLAKAFRGELVPQDPSDEPAAELLRRLREARAADTASKPKRGRAAKASTVSE